MVATVLSQTVAGRVTSPPITLYTATEIESDSMNGHCIQSELSSYHITEQIVIVRVPGSGIESVSTTTATFDLVCPQLISTAFTTPPNLITSHQAQLMTNARGSQRDHHNLITQHTHKRAKRKSTNIHCACHNLIENLPNQWESSHNVSNW